VINRGIGQWPPSEMDHMSHDDLVQWYKTAVKNIKAKNAAIEKANSAK